MFETLARTCTVNIECKTPREVSLRPNYDSDRLIKVLSDKIQNDWNKNFSDVKCSDYCFVSSFDHNCLERFRKYQSDNILEADRVRTMYLHTRKLTDILPGAEVTSNWDSGTNIQTSAANADVVKRFQDNG